MAWTTTGTLYTFGYGTSGRMGLPARDRDNGWVPEVVRGLEGRRVVFAAGSNHTVVCTDQNEIFTFGYGISGSLGHGGYDRVEPLPRTVDFTNLYVTQEAVEAA